MLRYPRLFRALLHADAGSSNSYNHCAITAHGREPINLLSATAPAVAKPVTKPQIQKQKKIIPLLATRFLPLTR